MTDLRDRCLSHFQTLGIPLRPDTLDGALSKAEKESLPHLSFLDQLLGPPAAARHERAVERRIREARFAEPKTLEGFDWKLIPRPSTASRSKNWPRAISSAGVPI